MTDRTVVQRKGLDVHETEDGLVVYQPDLDRVHYLNETAAAVFVFAASSSSVESLAEELAALWELDEPPTAAVDRCVTQLLDEGVLRSAPC